MYETGVISAAVPVIKHPSNFEGCFITGTAAEITPVSCINDNKYKVCDLILDLSKNYEDLVGKN